METIYLSRRNLLTLQHKLNRLAAGEDTACTIIKNDTVHSKYPCSTVCRVIAVEDDEYYDRKPGTVHPRDR